MKYTVDFRLAPEGGAKTKSSFVVNEAQKLEITNAFRYLADYIVFSDTDTIFSPFDFNLTCCDIVQNHGQHFPCTIRLPEFVPQV